MLMNMYMCCRLYISISAVPKGLQSARHFESFACHFAIWIGARLRHNDLIKLSICALIYYKRLFLH